MAGADILLDRLDRLERLRRERRRDAERRARLHRITEWQNQRLARTHADLLASPRYRPAVRFFLTDLYAPMDFSHRERALARVSPVLARVLSDRALRTMGRALEMNLVTEELDDAMERELVELGFPDPLTDAAYARAYRRCDDARKRQRQIELIREVGEDLDGVVARPWVRKALRLARGPAGKAGLGELHELLERGFDAFHHMQGSKDFLDAICGRELQVMKRIYDRHPEPFDLDG